MVFFTGDGFVEFFVNFPMAGINATIADHLIMLFWDVPDKAFNKI